MGETAEESSSQDTRAEAEQLVRDARRDVANMLGELRG